jgi:hypothetical protein
MKRKNPRATLEANDMTEEMAAIARRAACKAHSERTGQKIDGACTGKPDCCVAATDIGAYAVEAVKAVAPMIERQALEKGYLAGFKASGEGWNGEYGCDNPTTDAYWLQNREAAIRALIGDSQPRKDGV